MLSLSLSRIWTTFRRSAGLGQRTNADSIRSGQPFVPPLLLWQDQNHISRHSWSAADDLVSSLLTDHFALHGPAISEGDDIQSWIQNVVTRWERQHGPIPKKEVLPHETG